MTKTDISGLPAGNWVTREAPRVHPLERHETSRLGRFILGRIRRVARAERDFNVFRTMARLGTIFPAHAIFLSRVLKGGRIPGREKELVVLRVGWRLGCIYEYGHHYAEAKHLGLSAAEIQWATAERSPAEDTRLGAFLSFADELVSRHIVSNETWARARRFASDDELLELCLFVGHYVMMGMTLNTAGIQLEPEFGIPAGGRR